VHFLKLIDRREARISIESRDHRVHERFPKEAQKREEIELGVIEMMQVDPPFQSLDGRKSVKPVKGPGK
jgi:hypothetical protein